MPEYSQIIRNHNKYPEAGELETLFRGFEAYNNVTDGDEVIAGWDTFNDNYFYLSPSSSKLMQATLNTQYKIYGFDENYIENYNKKFAKAMKVLVRSSSRKHLIIKFGISYPAGENVIIQSDGFAKEVMGGLFVMRSKVTAIGDIQPQRVSVVNEITGQVLLDLSDKVRKILSDREMEVVELLARGYNDKKIGEALFLSSYTILSHRRNIIKKMRAKNTVEAVVKAYRLI